MTKPIEPEGLTPEEPDPERDEALEPNPEADEPQPDPPRYEAQEPNPEAAYEAALEPLVEGLLAVCRARDREEPAWMLDVRRAQARLGAQRAIERSRRSHEEGGES